MAVASSKFISEIRAGLDAIARNAAIRDGKNFAARAEAIDFIESDILARIEVLQASDASQSSGDPRSSGARDAQALSALKSEAERVSAQLESIDETLFLKLRAELRAAKAMGSIRGMMDAYVGPEAWRKQARDAVGYDCLDAFVNGLLHSAPIPVETRPREAEMVFFQKTPARIVMELADEARLTEKDVFYDLGSGLGQVAMLIRMLTGARAKGIEFDPAYCEYARARASDLDLSGVEFVCADAREADYSDGTAFFLYTPFEGAMLEAVLDKLRREPRGKIRLFTYGPCTSAVSRQRWLRRIGAGGDHPFALARFET